MQRAILGLASLALVTSCATGGGATGAPSDPQGIEPTAANDQPTPSTRVLDTQAEPLKVTYPPTWDAAVEHPFVEPEREHESRTLIVETLDPEPDPQPDLDPDPDNAPEEIDLADPITLDASVLFASGTAIITVEADATLLDIALAAVGQLAPGQRVRIDGHVDEVGTVEFNEWLGNERAEAVKNRIVRNAPELEGRVDAIGHGEDELVHPGCRSDCAENRVVIIGVTS